MDRDHLFTEQVRADVESARLAWIDVDGSRSVDELSTEVADRLGLA